ncbi:hypothetical protein VARIO8X_20203 [Burkholderiales bacterium 8X]|nr:hypothetical protein VARIO8X_20203 [Burkholderiales bacterium 8X]
MGRRMPARLAFGSDFAAVSRRSTLGKIRAPWTMARPRPSRFHVDLPPRLQRSRSRHRAILLRRHPGLRRGPQHRYLGRLRLLRAPDLAAPRRTLSNLGDRPCRRRAGADASLRHRARTASMAAAGRTPRSGKRRLRAEAASAFRGPARRAMDDVLLRPLRQPDRGQGLSIAFHHLRRLNRHGRPACLRNGRLARLSPRARPARCKPASGRQRRTTFAGCTACRLGRAGL